MGDFEEQQQPSSSSPKPAANAENPEDLATLLDSALADFGKQRNTDDELDELMNEMDQSAAQKAASDFQTMLNQLLEVQNLATEKAADGTGSADPEDVEGMRSFADMLAKMSQSTGDIANAPDEKAFLESMMKMGSNDSPMEPFMGMMMQAFLTKDVMYPPMKELADGFPVYLEQHKDSLDAETLERYQKQQEVVGKICAAYEEDFVDESDEAAGKERFEHLGKLLVDLQSHGYPPTELAGTLPPGWGMDGESGIPKLEDASAAAENCNIM